MGEHCTCKHVERAEIRVAKDDSVEKDGWRKVGEYHDHSEGAEEKGASGEGEVDEDEEEGADDETAVCGQLRLRVCSCGIERV